MNIEYPPIDKQYWTRTVEGIPRVISWLKVPKNINTEDKRNAYLFEHPLFKHSVFEGFSEESKIILSLSGYTIYDVRHNRDGYCLGIIIEIDELVIPIEFDDKILSFGETWLWRDAKHQFLLVCEEQIYIVNHLDETSSADWIVDHYKTQHKRLPIYGRRRSLLRVS